MFGGNCWRCATDPPTPVFNRMRPKMPPPGAFIIRPAQRRYYRPDQIAHEVIPGRGARVEYIPAQSPLSPHRPPRTRTCRNCARMIGGDGRPGDRFDATYPAYYVEAGKCEDCRAAAALARAESADAILAIDDLLPNEVGLLDEVATRNAREQTTELPSAEQCPNGPRRRRIKRLKRDLPASAADKLATKGLPLGAVVPYPLLLPDDGETIRSEVATCRRVTAIGLEWTPPHPEDRAMSRRASRQNEPTKPVGSKRLRPVNDPMRFSREGKGGRASVVSHLLQ